MCTQTETPQAWDSRLGSLIWCLIQRNVKWSRASQHVSCQAVRRDPITVVALDGSERRRFQ